DVCPPLTGSDRGHLSSHAARRLVPACGSSSWIVGRSIEYAIADRSRTGGPQDPAPAAMAARGGRCSPLEVRDQRTGAGTLELARPLGRTRNGAHGDHG